MEKEQGERNEGRRKAFSGVIFIEEEENACIPFIIEKPAAARPQKPGPETGVPGTAGWATDQQQKKPSAKENPWKNNNK